MNGIRFTYKQAYCDRMHYINEEDVKVVLSRLPEELYERLQTVHFNDKGRGVRILGYTTIRGRREITICALPPRVSLSRFLVLKQTPSTFGADRGQQWPALAVRRFLLYDVFLHELGHLQIIDAKNRNPNRKFANETKAHLFADFWRKQLWNEYFVHSDSVHNSPLYHSCFL